MYSDRIKVIDANKTIEEISREIKDKLNNIVRKGNFMKLIIAMCA